VGPLLQAEPIGGRSLLELSFEVRLKITETIGMVTFLDGGSAFGDVFPDFNESLRWGTGLGFRYFTAVGPIRLDLGIPLNRRDGIDKSFQIYISLGQAF
jgi:translocation and assembly module TamA